MQIETKIVMKTVGVGDTKDLTAGELVAYIARVSNPGNQENHGSAKRLLSYLRTNSHWSPFEHIFYTIELKTTRDIARQLLRHRSFYFQEFSQRYAVVDEGFSISLPRLQDHKNRQNSLELGDSDEDWDLKAEWVRAQNRVALVAKEEYTKALRQGIAKEVARKVLPEGLTPSRLYMTGNLRSWIHYCELRMGNGTQKEHILLASECYKLIEKELEE